MKSILLPLLLSLTSLDAATLLLKGDAERPEDESRLVAALGKLKGPGGGVILDGGIWMIRKEIRLPSNVSIRGTNDALLRLPSPRLVSLASPAGAQSVTVHRATDYAAGGELALLSPGSGKERIATVRIKSIEGRTLHLAEPLPKTVPAKSRIGYSHRMFLGYAVTNVNLINLAIDGGRNAAIPMPGHHLRSAIWISAPYKYEKGPTGKPSANITVRDCSVTNCYGRAVAFYHTVDSAVINCRIGGLNDEAIDFDHFARRCRAIGNEIDGATIGVELNDASDCEVLRNRIRNTHIGVRIWWYNRIDPAGLNTRNRIIGNHIADVTRAAIHLGRNCRQNQVLRNTVHGKIEGDRAVNEFAENSQAPPTLRQPKQ
jgi:hypothetical protein